MHVRKGLVASIALAATSALSVTDSVSAAEWEDYLTMQEEVVSADALLSADVMDTLNPVGSVSDLVLNEEGNQIQYILYEAPYPYSLYGAEDGFATFENIDLSASAIMAGVNVRLSDEAAAQAPEELTLTEDEADHRLVSNLLGERVEFSDNETRKITDLLIDRDTGAVTHFVFDMDAESLFDTDRRAIPADMVSINDQGEIMASTDIRGVDEITQEYDEELL